MGIKYKELYNNLLNKFNILETNFNKITIEFNILQEKMKDLTQYSKGHKCSKYGHEYEIKNYNILKNTFYNKNKFNTQSDYELGGSSNNIDILCNFNKERDIGIEVKKYNSPDWMQFSLKYYNNWEVSKQSKIHNNTRKIINNLLQNIKLFNNEIPPFITKNITHEEWLVIKQNTNKWNDYYIDIPNNIIKNIYKNKGCSYIQISDNYGLYHLGEDICNFNVPEFIVEQELRIRTKIHCRKKKNGYCQFSINASCIPKNLHKSLYSLDNIEKLPTNLKYKII